MKCEWDSVFVPQLATCVAAEANPPANITWLKNNKPLVVDGDGMSFFRVSWSELPCDFSCLVFSVFFGFVLFFIAFISCVGTSIHASVLVDPITGLSTTSSVLEYSAKKEDTNAEFTCRTVEDDLVSQPVTFTITCESPHHVNRLYWFGLAYVSPQRKMIMGLQKDSFGHSKKLIPLWGSVQL